MAMSGVEIWVSMCITSHIMTNVLRAALVDSGPEDPDSLTLHGFRRGAAQAAIKLGSSLKSNGLQNMAI